MQLTLNQQNAVQVGADPPSYSGIAKLVKRLTVNQVIRRFDSCSRSHPRREAGASSRLISGRDRLSPRSRLDTWGGDQVMPGLSSGDGASPTKKISGVRSSTPVPCSRR